MNTSAPDRPAGRRGLHLLLAGLLVLGSTLALPPAFAKQDNAEQSLLDTLTALNEKAAEVEDLEAIFEQQRFTPLLRKPITSTGRVRAVTGQSRWDTDTPYASVMRIRANRLELYYPEQKTLEVYPLQRRLGALAASPMPRLETWRKHFRIEPASARELPKSLRESAEADDNSDACVLVRLTPKDEELAAQVATILVVVDRQTGLSRAMAWSGREGERTEIVFSEMRVNRGVKPSDLAIELPEDTKVVYPMGPVDEDAEREGE